MITPLYINQTIMYWIDDEGYLCCNIYKGNDIERQARYKVNKEGLFEEVKEVKEEKNLTFTTNDIWGDSCNK